MMTRQHGFNIIEMMVGLTIGLLGLLAVSQVMINFSQQRNTTTQALEAQSNGTMALFLIERDLTQAGYGLLTLSDCPNIQWSWNPLVGCVVCGLQAPLTTAPVIITDGGAGSDTLEIQYAKSVSGSPGALVVEDQGAYTDHYKLASVAGFAVGDMVVADVNTAGVRTCTMSQITAINDDTAAADADKSTLEHATTSDYNPAAAASAAGWKPALINTLLANVGTYVSKQYSIVGNSLNVATFPSNADGIAADNIVFMKAQYGRDTNNDGAVDVWSSGATVITDYKTVLAVRVGVIARSPLLEKDAIDTATVLDVLPEIEDGGGTTIGAQVTYDVTALADGDHYRHKAYYTIVPIRNVIWSR